MTTLAATDVANGVAPQADSARGRVLRVGPLKPSLEAALTEKYDALALPVLGENRPASGLPAGDRAAFLAEHGDTVTAVVTSGRTGVDATLMNALPHLGAIVHFGVGYDTTDIGLAEQKGVGVSNTPDVLTDCVADTALGLIIDTLRGFSAADRYVRAGRWAAEGNVPLTRKVSGSRVGIVGLGRIGTAIAHRLDAFDCVVSYHNRREIPGSPYAYAASPVELAASVDVLVVAAAGGSGTRKLVDRDVLTALGRTGYLINVARGSVVDQNALVELLVTGELAGAGLDVFTDEPTVPDALLTLPNVVLLPHVGSGTVETRAAMEALTLENLDQFLTSRTLTTPVLQPKAAQ